MAISLEFTTYGHCKCRKVCSAYDTDSGRYVTNGRLIRTVSRGNYAVFGNYPRSAHGRTRTTGTYCIDCLPKKYQRQVVALTLAQL